MTDPHPSPNPAWILSLISPCDIIVAGVPAEEVARNAVDELTSNLQHNSCVDEHLQDQVSIPGNSLSL